MFSLDMHLKSYDLKEKKKEKKTFIVFQKSVLNFLNSWVQVEVVFLGEIHT